MKALMEKMMVDLLHSALDYRRRGLPITLCDDKSPLGKGWTATSPGKAWQRHTWTPKEICRAFDQRGELNVGSLWGPRSGMVDFECDGDGAERSFSELFDGIDQPVTPMFQSSRGKHRLFAWNDELELIGKATAHFGELELKVGAAGRGSQSLLPPSKTSDFCRKWLVSLDDCKPAALPDKAIKRILASLMTGAAVNRETEEIALFSLSLCKHPDDAVLDAIKATLPTGFGHRHRRLFSFARLLKAIPSLADADVRTLRPIVQQWHQHALPNIGTRNFDDTWIDFANGWQNVKFPAGKEPIRMIYEQAIAEPLPPLAERYETLEVKRLVVLCRALQLAAGEQPFYLACRTAGELLGISHVLAAKWLKLLILDNVIEVTTPGSQCHAARYRYLGG
jgi:hypothetical protein